MYNRCMSDSPHYYDYGEVGEELTDGRFFELVGWFLEARHEERRALEEIERLCELERAVDEEMLPGRSALGLAELRSRRDAADRRKAEISSEWRCERERLETAEQAIREVQETLFREGMPTGEWFRVGGHGELAVYLEEDLHLTLEAMPWRDVEASPAGSDPETVRCVAELREELREARGRRLARRALGWALLFVVPLLFFLGLSPMDGVASFCAFAIPVASGLRFFAQSLALSEEVAEAEGELRAWLDPDYREDFEDSEEFDESAGLWRMLGRGHVH